MSVYRKAPTPLSKAPSAPWWRILRAWVTGTFSRLLWARQNREAEIRRRQAKRGDVVLHGLGWVPRGYASTQEYLRQAGV